MGVLCQNKRLIQFNFPTHRMQRSNSPLPGHDAQSNARVMPGEGMLKFRIDRRIISNCWKKSDQFPTPGKKSAQFTAFKKKNQVEPPPIYTTIMKASLDLFKPFELFINIKLRFYSHVNWKNMDFGLI